MRVGLISGDGLDVSGLLTVARNVFALGWANGWIEPLVPTDLGYSWRPDKVHDYPKGRAHALHPPWMQVSEPTFLRDIDIGSIAIRLTTVRRFIAIAATLDQHARQDLSREIERLAVVYRGHFKRWLARHDPDWVFALNMTLSDAVPATMGLRQAAREHYEPHTGRGVVFWDHDLFRSCGIWDGEAGQRYYPDRPNELTPVPQDDGRTRWIVVNESLRDECLAYPTELLPTVRRNILPRGIGSTPPRLLRRFAEQHRLRPDRPIVLNPVRVFRIKGVDLALRFFAGLWAAADRQSQPRPYLLVFGSLDEDPEYAKEVQALSRELGIAGAVRFLDGVPVSTMTDGSGRLRLDEIDLLGLAAATRGGVLFTPTVRNVETVGLGPALAACAGLPIAASDYTAFNDVYGPDLVRVRVPVDPGGRFDAVMQFRDQMRAWSTKQSHGAREANRQLVAQRFPVEPWKQFLHELNIGQQPATGSAL